MAWKERKELEGKRIKGIFFYVLKSLYTMMQFNFLLNISFILALDQSFFFFNII